MIPRSPRAATRPMALGARAGLRSTSALIRPAGRAGLAKNGLAHRVPLSRQALTVLERLRKRANGPWVFPSPTTDRPIENPQKAAERLRKRSKVTDLRLHDLRRTAASLMTGMGIARLTVKDPEPRRARRNGCLRPPLQRPGEANGSGGLGPPAGVDRQQQEG